MMTTTSASSSSSPTSTESTANDEFSKEQPDPDNIKMFVGQIPKTLDETQLKKMFEQFGRVHTINVLRDKVTGVSKGKMTFQHPSYFIFISTYNTYMEFQCVCVFFSMYLSILLWLCVLHEQCCLPESKATFYVSDTFFLSSSSFFFGILQIIC